VRGGENVVWNGRVGRVSGMGVVGVGVATFSLFYETDETRGNRDFFFLVKSRPPFASDYLKKVFFSLPSLQ
jgi:hypothetical protein